MDRLTPLLLEIDEFLMGESKVHATLARIAQRLNELGVDFALAGGLAVVCGDMCGSRLMLTSSSRPTD